MVVAKGYRPVDRDQRFLMPPDMRECLSADHPVWLVIAAIGQIDTSALHRHRRTRGVGGPGNPLPHVKMPAYGVSLPHIPMPAGRAALRVPAPAVSTSWLPWRW